MNSRWQIVFSLALVMLAVVGGMTLGVYAVDVYKDLRFLHDFRIATELQMQKQAQPK